MPAERDLAAAGTALRQALGAAAAGGGDDAESLAELAGHVAPDDWARAGDDGRTALDILREAVRVAAGHLAAAEKARSRA